MLLQVFVPNYACKISKFFVITDIVDIFVCFFIMFVDCFIHTKIWFYIYIIFLKHKGKINLEYFVFIKMCFLLKLWCRFQFKMIPINSHILRYFQLIFFLPLAGIAVMVTSFVKTVLVKDNTNILVYFCYTIIIFSWNMKRPPYI